jgi:hypothetical protein
MVKRDYLLPKRLGTNRLWAETERWMIDNWVFLLPASHLKEKM